MERGCMNGGENIYLRCRKEAAKYNERLRSREGASELLGISVSSLANYELGITKVIPPDVVIMMADLYNAPQLVNHYCLRECPIGCRHPISDEVLNIERVTVKLLKGLRVDQLHDIKDKIIDIAEDGVISTDEEPEMAEVLAFLDELAQTISELRTIGKMALNGRDDR